MLIPTDLYLYPITYRYDKNVLNVKVDSCVDEDHSDTELLMMAFHSMFYR